MWLEQVSLNEMRSKIALLLGVEADALDLYTSEVRELLRVALQQHVPASNLTLPEELQPANRTQIVYLCAISRALARLAWLRFSSLCAAQDSGMLLLWLQRALAAPARECGAAVRPQSGVVAIP